MNKFTPDLCHETLLAKKRPALAFKPEADFNQWKKAVKEKLVELLGDMPDKVPFNLVIEWEKEHEDYYEKRFYFQTELQTLVPCHLLIPKNAKKPCPVIICLQGHSTGMHISLGRAIHEGDEEQVSGGDRDFALQAIKQGYAALVIEQRGFGERRSDFNRKTSCEHPGMVALLLGRTLIGERVWDVSRAIDVMKNFSELDLDRIGIMGNSGGGTASYYTACMDERIKVVIPSCSICTYKASIGAMGHCVCNYIPHISKYLDMGDISCLIAPRPLIVVAGNDDPIFPIKGVNESFSVIKQIYQKAGYESNCKLVIGEGGHRFYADLAWKEFKNLTNW